MAATSPYTPNDYTAVSNFRPYELPINDIFKGISAQSMFWEAGAARVKSVYDNALNLKLSLEPNKEIRKQYMLDSEKQLTKLSSMDLADPSVQRQGFGLFKPLFQDEGIIYDDLTTRHYEKVRNDALSYRGKDNGKQYSDINFQYAMTGYNEFINSKDRMAGKGFYENRKEYTPYYDYTEDFQTALKDCKPSSLELQSPNYGKNNSITGYTYETYSKELSAAQVRGCLEGGLSPNGQRQLQIEGAVAYKNSLPTLASDTSTYLSGVGKNLGIQLEQLNAKKLALAAKKDVTPDQKKLIGEQLDNEIKATETELNKTNNQNKKLIAGDFTDIQNNFDAYAGTMHSYKKILKKSLASAYEEQRRVYKADPVQLNAIRFSQEKYLRSLDNVYDVGIREMEHMHDKEMKLLDLIYGGSGTKGAGTGADVFRNPLTGEITLNPNIMRETPNITDKPEVNEKIYAELTNAVSTLSQEDNTNNLTLYNNLKNRGERDKDFRGNLLKAFNYGASDDEWARFKADHANNSFDGGKGIQGTAWFKTYTAEKPDDEDVNSWSYQNTLVQTGMSVLNRKLAIGEAEVQKRLGGDYEQVIRTKLQTIPSVQTDAGEVTAQDIQDAEKGISQKVKFVDTPVNTSSITSSGNVSISHPGMNRRYYVNGKEVSSNVLRDIDNKVNKAVQSESSKLNSTRVDVYNTLGFNREPWYFTPNDKGSLVETLKGVVGLDSEKKEQPIRIISSDFSGGVKVFIPGVEKGEDKGGVLEKLRAAGVGTSVEATGDGVVTIRGTTHNVIQQAINNPILAQAAFQMATIGETPDFQQTQEGDRAANQDIQIPALIRGKQERITIETYKKDGRPEYRVFVEGATTPKPVVVAGNAYELFEKIGRLPIDLNTPIKK